MKKLPLLLALALSLASFAFAEKQKNSVDCSRHEYKKINGEYRKFKDGRDVTESKNIEDQLSGLMCGDKMKGLKEARIESETKRRSRFFYFSRLRKK